MLANLLNNEENREHFDVSLSYRASNEYATGLSRRVRLDFPVYPLRYPEPSGALPAPESAPRAVRRLLRFCSRQLATGPLFVYEVWLLRRLFMQVRPDVLHINNGGYPAALSARAAAIAGWLARVPHVLMVVNNLAEEYRGPLSAIRRAVDRAVVACVSTFLTGSSAAALRLRDVLHLSEGHYAAYPNGVAIRAVTETREETLARFGLSGFNGVLFGIVALMEPRKGHRVLLEAVERLVGKDGSAPLNFVVLLEGDGPLRHELEEIVDAHGLERQCIFAGRQENVMNLMSALDVLVLPSISHEDFPNVTIEAMAMGKPLIASRLAGTPEQVLDGETGFLVPPGDSAALADAIMRLASDAALRARMGAAGRRQFQELFTAEVAVQRYTRLYQSFIKDSAGQ